MPHAKDIYYNFDISYEKEWSKFIGQFPKDDELEKGSIAEEINQSCHELNRSIQHLYKYDPEYSAQCDIRWAWSGLINLLEEDNSIFMTNAKSWFVKQIINMINCTNPKIVDSIWYAISVDYFECNKNGSWMFPIMYEKLNERNMEKLMMYSISIPWKSKMETYRKAIQNKKHHELLADTLYHSCKAYCHGSAKASEALEILNRLSISKTIHTKVFDILTTPIEVDIMESIELPMISNKGITGFVSIYHNDIPTWFPYAELWIADTYVGTFNEDNLRISWRGQDSIHSKYHIPTPEEQSIQEYILPITIPFKKDWKGKTGLLKPI